MVVNRWFRTINLKYHTLGRYWTDSFVSYEHVLVDMDAVEADSMAFKHYCETLPDLWIPKRTWYGRWYSLFGDEDHVCRARCSRERGEVVGNL